MLSRVYQPALRRMPPEKNDFLRKENGRDIRTNVGKAYAAIIIIMIMIIIFFLIIIIIMIIIIITAFSKVGCVV